MTDKITEPFTPELTTPAPFENLAGDWKDDDAQVYQDDFSEYQGSDVSHAEGVPHAKAKIKPLTRLLTRYVTVGTVNGQVVDPIQMLPADPNRVALSIMAAGGANAVFMIGSDKTDCYNLNRLPVSPSNGAITLNGHTGAVWAYSQDATAIVVSVVAVTS